ncbi:GAF domain-containing protein [Halomicroarcula sp. F13]|uniref:GAF domain-containing protein n=1 Tax=Haloarcula rubra TaxID=2487747 RepID=A0AAW4PST8_9EURY|nr:GAF domain-containing protein [Halomicroarcula rubra]MBX0324231.1 GAF domain-containing protein [Halomicroarcula rubra]
MAGQSLTESLRETLALFDGTGTPLTTTEAADRLDLGRRSTYDRLDRLVDRGRLDTKKVGASARVWWRPPSDDPVDETDAARVLETAPVGLVAVAADGTVDRVNSRARATLDVDESAESAATDLRFYDEDGDPVPPADHPVRTVLDDDTPVSDRLLEHETPDGTRRWVRVSASPRADGGAVLACTDVTTLRQTQSELEREREQFADELREMVDRIDDAFFALDESWQFTQVNDRAATLLDSPADELVGERVWEVFPEAADSRFQTEYELAFETQESRSFEAYYPPLATWFEVTAYPSETGLSVYFRDVTDRRRRERELELYEAIVETVDDGIYAVDDDGEFVLVNEQFCDLTGYEEAELLGADATTVHSEAISQRARTMASEVVSDDRDVAQLELDVRTSDGGAVPCEARFSPFPVDDGVGRCGVVRDVSDRLEREAELERRVHQQEVVTDLGQRALADRNVDTLMRTATELVAETLDNEYCKVLDLDPATDELLLREGVGWDDGLVGSATVSAVANDSQASYTLASSAPVVVEDLTTERRFSGPDLLTDHDVRSGISVIIGPRDDPWGILGTHDTADTTFTEHDVNFVQSVATILASAIARRDDERELVDRRAELRRRERTLRRAHEIIADSDRSVEEQIESLLGVVRETVGTPYASLSHVQGSDYVFESVDAPADADLGAGDVVPLSYTNCDRVVSTAETLVLEDVERDAPELADKAGNAEWGISCYLGAPVTVDDAVYGTFCFYGMEPRTEEFSDWEVALVDLLSNWVGSELERQQHVELLSALNGLNEVFNEITTAVVEQSTREEIEETVCHHLANSASYQFAWVGEGDSGSQRVVPRAEAGAEDYLDGLEISVDPDDERGGGPTGEAIRTGEIQTVGDVRTADDYECWRDRAEAHGVRASAAVPIVHEDTVYGVLNLYTGRENAFEGRERVVVEQLGEVVGHAIAATQRKQALMSDEVVELQFHIPDVFETLDVDAGTCGTVTLDHAIPVTDDEYVVYGSATPDAVESVHAITDAIPHWESVTFRDDGTDFEARLSEPPVLSVVASVGGFVESAVVEDGDYRMTIRVSPTVDTRRIIDVVTDAYPGAQLLKRRQRTRDDDDRLQRELTEALTDRQLAALEAAYHGGFFEWPRDVSGQDVADSLDIAASTFHQHLRKAERKAFDYILSSAMPAST